MRATLLGLLGAVGLAAAKPIEPISLDPSSSSHEVPLPWRPLEWGDVNVIHTTDVHGWVSGHSRENYPEKSWSGNLGDLYSFSRRMRAKAKREGSDLLLVDTGDARIGHGLTDTILNPYDKIAGRNISMLNYVFGYDLVVPGNHDLQGDDVVDFTMEVLAPAWGEKFLTSNVKRTKPADPKKPFLGNPVRRWTTKKGEKGEKGRDMVAFGVVPIKTQVPSSLLEVVPIDQMIKEQWFQEAIIPKADVFILLGHVDPQTSNEKDKIELIHNAIREKHPDVPIMIFVGHTHQRWCKTFTGVGGDKSVRSMLLQSGRYFDTVGWMSLKIGNNEDPTSLKFSRRYLDNNLQTYMYHTGYGKHEEKKFHTAMGKSFTRHIQKMEESEELIQFYGNIGSGYYLDRDWWKPDGPNKNSLFEFYLNAVETTLIGPDNRSNWLFFSNWGIVRDDIHPGPFRKGDFYSMTPDASKREHFLHITVPRWIADEIVKKVKEYDNRGKECKRSSAQVPQLEVPSAIMDQSQLPFSLSSDKPPAKTLGWVTKDECEEDGDDVVHIPLPRINFNEAEDKCPVYFWRNNYKDKDLKPDAEVDVIFINRIGKKIPEILEKKFGITYAKVLPYNEKVFQNDLILKYIQSECASKSPCLVESDK